MGSKPLGHFIHMAYRLYNFLPSLDGTMLGCLGMGSKPLGNLICMASLLYIVLPNLDEAMLGVWAQRSMIQHIILPQIGLAHDKIKITPYNEPSVCSKRHTRGPLYVHPTSDWLGPKQHQK